MITKQTITKIIDFINNFYGNDYKNFNIETINIEIEEDKYKIEFDFNYLYDYDNDCNYYKNVDRYEDPYKSIEECEEEEAIFIENELLFVPIKDFK